ncbi:FGGY-family carbohydrate kinase [Nocardiopsis composta]|uniref:Erythritol kinase n=1 Tax=Nocardiopsis composta TaxID=157465 RepID=A0A7W8QGB3_9ACTN|nr:FGGY-family carbohydrate kinase [Nocardiopsis composta]MBB5429982.1 erythritol kinase [Nocardiopsis composta]
MIVGVDIGTSLTKAVAFGPDGRSVAHAGAASELRRYPDGRVEQDPEEVLGTVAAVVRRLAAELDGPVTAVALTGQGDGLWLRDEAGRPVRPAISWLDGRAAATVARWQAAGVDREVFRRTGSGLFPGCAAALLAHLDAEEPEVLDRAAVAGYCVDAVAQRLTGTVSVDVSDASLPFLDPATRRYDDTAIAACGLTHRRGLLAEPAPPGTVLSLDAEGARLLGLPEGLPVTAGPFDMPACAIGAGVREPGDGLLIAGTTLACQVLRKGPWFDREGEPSGMLLAAPDPELYLRAMAAMVGTAGLDWACELVGADVADTDGLLAASGPGAGGVRALPFLSGAGERAPFVDAAARARFTGLTLQHTRADLVRALCESVAFAARHCLEEAGLTGALYACGGGVRSPEWTGIFADVLGRPVTVPADPGVGARGAVITAARALGRPVDEERWAAGARTVPPRPENTGFYQRVYTGYRSCLAAARRDWAA